MRAVDTNVLLRILTGDDRQQQMVADDFIEEGAWVSLPVLVETIWTLGSRYGERMDGISTAVQMLLAHEYLTLQDADAVEIALGWFRERPSVGFSDCLILALAHKAGHLPLGTFDRSLGKLPGARRL